MYNAVYETAEVFENICPEYLDKSMQDPSVKDEESAPVVNYQISPIPNIGEFRLHGPVDKGYKLQLTNLDGKTVHQQVIEEETRLSLVKADLSSGTYLLSLKNAEGTEIFRKKIIIIQ